MNDQFKLYVNFPEGSSGMDNYGLSKMGDYYNAASAADVVGSAEWYSYVIGNRLKQNWPWLLLALVAGGGAYLAFRK